MKNLLTTASALVMASAVAATAGGVERTTQSVGFMFEAGDYAEFTYSFVNPKVSGFVTQAPPVVSGDISPGYSNVALAFKKQLTDNLSLGFKIDQPYGADVGYAAATGYPFSRSWAEVNSTALTGVVKYTTDNNISVLGGVRVQKTNGEVLVATTGNPDYTMETSSETDFGYLVGVAYEKPEIALRVALTYNSAIDHDFTVLENGGPSLPFTTTTPQSVNLEFQSGIAADTLVFGSVRWVEWSAFDITPVGFAVANGGASLVNYTDDRLSYSLGIGRKFSDTWSGAVTLGYEKTLGGVSGNLGPTDGYRSIGVAATYTKNNMKITGGVRYIMIGDANTSLGAPFTSTFSDNTGIAAGLRVGVSF